MPTVTVSDQIFDRLTQLANSRNVGVEAIVNYALEWLETTNPTVVRPDAATLAARRAAMDEWMQAVEKRADRYPPDHVLDVSRESFYPDR